MNMSVHIHMNVTDSGTWHQALLVQRITLNPPRAPLGTAAAMRIMLVEDAADNWETKRNTFREIVSIVRSEYVEYSSRFPESEPTLNSCVQEVLILLVLFSTKTHSGPGYHVKIGRRR